MNAKIEYRTPGGAGAWTVLADETDAGDATGPRVTNFMARPVPAKPLVDPLAFSLTASVRSQGNAVWEVSFEIFRTHASADAAWAYVETHGNVAAGIAVSAQIDIKVTQGATVRVLAHAAVEEWEPDRNPDLGTRFKYKFTGQTYS